MSSLYVKHNYTNKNIQIIRDVKIREYDIKSAGLNILYNKGYVDKETYEALMNMDKLKRNIVIGKWLKDNKEVNKVMMDEFIRIRKNFFQMNNLTDDDILSIKKDAIFVIDKNLNNLEFENYTFVCKEEYTDFIYMDRKEYYYNKYKDVLDVKGLPKNCKEFQQNYYLKLMKDILKLGKDKKAIFRKLIVFKDEYLNRELPKNYYRTVESCMYPFKIATLITYREQIPDSLLEKVDLTSNLHYINNLINIFI